MAKINWKEKQQTVVPAKLEPTKIELELEALKITIYNWSLRYWNWPTWSS